jgi:hypothetical protein
VRFRQGRRANHVCLHGERAAMTPAPTTRVQPVRAAIAARKEEA